MRLLCDEMLKRLGRWLRAAGYDTAVAENGASDRDLLDRAAAEDRILLTRTGISRRSRRRTFASCCSATARWTRMRASCATA